MAFRQERCALMMISLCVATRGDTDRLASFISSIQELKVSSPWEMILVHNSPLEIPDLLLKAAAGLPLLILHEPQPGKSRSLNRAIKAAKGQLLVFTDDDVQHCPDWLDRLSAAAELNSWASVFGGRIVPRGSVPTWIRRSSNLQSILLCEQNLGVRERRYPQGLYPYGPNMAVRRSAMEKSGALWPESIGPGTSLPVGDEYGFLAQISKPNEDDRLYVPDAIVYHNVASRYFSPVGAVSRSFRCGFAAGKMDARFGRAKKIPKLQRVVERLRGLRSPLEFACVIVRALGVSIGRYLIPHY